MCVEERERERERERGGGVEEEGRRVRDLDKAEDEKDYICYEKAPGTVACILQLHPHLSREIYRYRYLHTIKISLCPIFFNQMTNFQ